jgi:thymidylate synthase (FAD)
MGVAREQARKDLPLSTYTEAYWKIDLHNLLHFLRLRMDKHAQLEVRAYADVIGNEIVKRWCPLSWEAFSDYGLQALEFSRIELDIIKTLAAGDTVLALSLARDCGFLPPEGQPVKRHMEREELEGKLQRLGITAPWQ